METKIIGSRHSMQSRLVVTVVEVGAWNIYARYCFHILFGPTVFLGEKILMYRHMCRLVPYLNLPP